MKFSTGDKVLLKQTGEEGIVIAVINEKMFEILVNGTSFPAFSDEIEHPYLKWFTEKNKQKKNATKLEIPPVEKQKLRQQKLAKGIYLSFLPVYQQDTMEDIVTEIKVYLINELPIDIHFLYEMKIINDSIFKHQGRLASFTHLYLHNIPFADMNDHPRFHWVLSDTENTRGLKEITGIYRIKPVRLFERLNELQLKNEPTFSELLIEDFSAVPVAEHHAKVEKPVTMGKAAKKPRTFTLKEIPKFEIDLHIEQLIANIQGLSNADILHVQLSHLRQYINLSIAHRMTKIIIIHGVGKGVLRDAVHQVLKEYPQIDHYTNEWHGSYGFGATQAFLKY